MQIYPMSETTRDDQKQSKRVHGVPVLNRRQFLAGGVSLLAMSASSPLFHAQAEEPTDALDPMRVPGALPRSYGERSPFEKQIRLVAPTSSTTPLQDLQGIITPSALHFERHHNGVPAIDPARHRLLIHGLVDRPLFFTLEELRRLPSASRIAFVECSGNSRDGWGEARNATVQGLHGLTSTSEWTGVKLSTLLEAVHVQREATWILAEGSDGLPWGAVCRLPMRC